jgi:hypothetical protein
MANLPLAILCSTIVPISPSFFTVTASVVEMEPQGPGTFGWSRSWSRSWSRNVEVLALAPGQLKS